MKKIYILIILFVILGVPFSETKAQSSNDSSIVYFTRDISPAGVMKLFDYLKDSVHGNVGIKVHFG